MFRDNIHTCGGTLGTIFETDAEFSALAPLLDALQRSVRLGGHPVCNFRIL